MTDLPPSTRSIRRAILAGRNAFVIRPRTRTMRDSMQLQQLSREPRCDYFTGRLNPCSNG